jgi:hypothetical protein
VKITGRRPEVPSVDRAVLTSEWPELSYAEGAETWGAIHMWLQMAGKIRMARAPAVNHWWHVTLQVTSRGFATWPIPAGERTFELRFDFIDHLLAIACSDGGLERLPFRSESVAAFYGRLVEALGRLDLATPIWTTPCEIPDPIAFERDDKLRTYDPDQAQRLWRAFAEAERIMTRFRGRYLGKSSPVHLFWGAFDLAVTRFSGRKAPPHPSSPLLPDRVNHEAYSHEVASVGFWPGGPGVEPSFYAYAYPDPAGFGEAAVPAGARYDTSLWEFLLPYETVRRAPDPEALLLDFFQKTYEAAADLGGWPRAELERPESEWP